MEGQAGKVVFAQPGTAWETRTDREAVCAACATRTDQARTSEGHLARGEAIFEGWHGASVAGSRVETAHIQGNFHAKRAQA